MKKVEIVNQNVQVEGGAINFEQPPIEQPEQPIEAQPAADAIIEDAVVQPQGGEPAQVAVEPPKVEVPPQEPIYKEYSQDELWEKLGIDEGGKKIFDAYKAGKLDEFVSIKNTDYDKMSDLELLRLDLAQKYPNMTKEKLDVLYNKKLSSYGLSDEFDEEGMETGKILLEADMLSVRDGLKTKQKEYAIAAYQNPNQVSQEQLKAQQAEFEAYVNNLPEFKKFETDRVVKFGNGEVNFVAPNELDLKRATIDPEHFFSQFMEADKTLKSEKWIKAVTYANNAEMVEKALIDYGKALGRKEENEALRNPSSRQSNNEPIGETKSVVWKGFVQQR